MGSMKITSLMAGALAVSLLGTGCATKRYVAKSIAPVEQRVTGTETKNTEQDKTIAAQGTEITELDTSLSRTKEKLSDVDNKATQAGAAAGQKADSAQQTANGAQQSADGAKMFAEQGIDRLGRTIDGMNRFNMAKS